jgi:hypothetical protein
MIAAAAVACALLAVAGTLAGLRLTSTGSADTALAQLITEVTTVPVGTSELAGRNVVGARLPVLPAPSSGTSAYSSTLQITDVPVAVSGPPLTQASRPEVLYIATEYCPYCAEENWALIVALSRFGHFTGLMTSRSPQFEQTAPIDSWTFYGSSYTSRYLAFVPVETHSNVLVSPKANKESGASYRVLQRLTPAQQAVLDDYDQGGSTPFLDFGNQTRPGRLRDTAQPAPGPDVAAARRRPPAAEDSAGRGTAERDGLAHRPTVPTHR